MIEYLGTIGGLTRSLLFIGTAIISVFGHVRLTHNLIHSLYKEHSSHEEAEILKNAKNFLNQDKDDPNALKHGLSR